MSYRGDFRLGDTLDLKFCTVQSTGAPTTLAGTPVISAYVGNSTTQITAGITLSVDFDGVTGLHHVRVVASSGNGYATASNYDLVITTGTVNGVSAVGYVVGSFSIENRSGLMPTTATRTLAVNASGEASVDVTAISGDATAANNLEAALDGSGYEEIRRGTAQAGAATTITLDASASATNDFYTYCMVRILSGTGAGQVRQITDYVGATKVATVGTWATNPDNTSVFVIEPFVQIAGATAPTAAEIRTEIDSNSTQLAAIVSAVDTVDNFLDTEIAAIKAKTDSLTFTVANQVDANVLGISGSTTAADALEAGALGTVRLTVGAGSTTTAIATNLTEATNDHYNGRVIVFLTGALAGQAGSITDYVGATKVLTVSALTEAPADTDTAIIV
jgi:hypothetical protein